MNPNVAAGSLFMENDEMVSEQATPTEEMATRIENGNEVLRPGANGGLEVEGH